MGLPNLSLTQANVYSKFYLWREPKLRLSVWV